MLVTIQISVLVVNFQDRAMRHCAQMQEGQAAMRSVCVGKTVRCALLFADGVLSEM
jgi:hypothetical protein